MPLTQHRTVPWYEVVGADGEKIFAVGAAIGERVSLSSPGGNASLSSSVVPSGTIWVVTFGLAVDTTSAITGGNIVITRASSVALIVVRAGALAAGFDLHFYVDAILFPGDKLQTTLNGTVAGDSLVFTYGGYSMTIP